jgi:predicted DNA-binding antitoxin AbrB/MazE fold protein
MDKPSTTMPATVDKIIKPLFDSEPEKAQIAVEGADHLYRELRIENVLTGEDGEQVRLKEGAEVQVTIEADPEATTQSQETQSEGAVQNARRDSQETDEEIRSRRKAG